MSEALRQAIAQASLATLDAGAVVPRPALRREHLRRLKEALLAGPPARAETAEGWAEAPSRSTEGTAGPQRASTESPSTPTEAPPSTQRGQGWADRSRR